VRESGESIGKDFEKSLGSPAEEKPVEVKPEQQELGTAAAPALPEPDAPAPAIVAPTPEPATAAAAAAEPASTERTG
jgi:hypothetical protein